MKSQKLHQKLRDGDSAPQFQATDVLGIDINLADYKDKFVLLVFLRYSGCPWCNLTLHRLTLEYPMLQQNGCEVIAFVQSSADNITANMYGRQQPRPPFPIIGDPERHYYDLYGVGTSVKAAARSIVDIPYWLKAVYEHGYKQTKIDGNMLIVPATFLVGADSQEVIKVEYSSSFYDHATFTSIYEPLVFK